jgi:iron complex outermembrane recepter protein
MSRTRAIPSRFVLLSAGVLSTAISSAGIAQVPAVAGPVPTAEGMGSLAEIVVTAERRSENLQTTPIAVTALSADALRSQSVSQFSDLARTVPGLSISSASTTAPGSATPVVYIRGIGQQDPSIFQDPGVGIYVDGVYVARSAGSAIDLPDIERVEVLRGPQGTLFGKNAVGGAINIVTQTPSDVPTGSLDATIGNYNLVDLRGLVSGPVATDLAGGLALDAKREDGYVDRLSYPDRSKTGTEGGVDHLSGRTRLHWTPMEDLSVDFSADYTRYQDESAAGLTTVYPPTSIYTLWNTLVASKGGLTWTPADAETGGKYSTFATGPNFADDHIYGSGIWLSWKLPWATFRSITAYRYAHETYSRDSDGSPADFFSATGYHQTSQYSQELQLLGSSFEDRLKWISGLYYLHENGQESDLAIIAPGLYTETHNTSLELGRLYGIKTTTDSYAGFGQATFYITRALGLTAGLRYTSEPKSAVVSSFGTESGILYVPPTAVSKTFSSLTPKYGIQYQVDPNVMLYASATKGFKSGGFNGRVSTLAGLTTFAPETVWSYEGGVKSTLLDNRLRINLAGYYMDYDNIQLAYFILTPGGVVNAVSNVAAAELHGVEAEVAAVPVSRLRLAASASWEDNYYTNIQPGAQVVKGDKMPYTPKWTASFSADYAFILPGDATLTPHVDYSFKGRTFAVISNSFPSELSAYSLVNARLTYAPANDHWSLAAYATNLTNRYYFTSAQDNTTASLLYRLLGRPREFGLTLHIRF